MLRRLGTNKKSLVIVPLALALALTWLFLPVKEVSIEPYGTLSLESRVVITTGYQAAYASPALESLWSGSNSVSTAELTLTSSANAYGSETGTWADARGLWAKDPYEYWTFVMDSSAVGAGTINTVTLSLTHYQSEWVDDSFNIDVFDGSTWNTARAYTSGDGPPITGTADNWDVSLVLDTWTKIDAAQVRIIGNEPLGKEDTVDWFVDTVELRIDYAPDIFNLPTSKNFLTVNSGTDYWAYGGTTAPGFPLDSSECFFEVTNNSSQAVNIKIKSTDFSGGAPAGWDLGDPSVADTVRLKVGKSGDTVEGDMVTLAIKDTDYDFILGLLGLPSAPDNTKKWELKMETPASFSNGDPKSATITLTASFSL